MPLFGKFNIDKLEVKGDINGLIKALGYRGSSKGFDVRKDAAEALGRIGDTRAVGPLILAIRTHEAVIVNEAICKALVEIGQSAVEPLIAALNDVDWEKRRYAAFVLGEISDARAVEPLIATLSHVEWGSKWSVVKALEKIGDARAVEPLIFTLRDRDARLGEATAKAIIRILENADVSESARQSALAAIRWGKARGWGKLTFDLEVPGGDGLCSDDQCPCPGTSIPRGTGYLYISQDVVKFRGDALTLQEAQRKGKQLKQHMGGAVLFGAGAITPILMCKQGAELRGLNLKVAAQDARYWWETGTVLLRATPLAVKSQGKIYKEAQTTKHPTPFAKPPARKIIPQTPKDETPSEITRKDTAQFAATDSEEGFFFQISTAFMMKEKGLVVVGKVVSGTITSGEVVVVESSRGALEAEVVELTMFAKQLKKASAGEEVGLTLGGIDSPISTEQVKEGMIIRSKTQHRSSRS